MVKYKYKGVQYNVPTMPEDIDFGQYLDLKASHKELTFVDVLSILVGVDASNIESQEFQSLLIAQTKWIADLINDCNEPEYYSTIEWEGKQVSIPKSFGEMNLGQRLMLEQEFNSHHDNADIKELYIKACCIFLAPCIYGQNWSDELELMQGIIIHHEARKLMRLCNFFLSKQKPLTSFGIARLYFQKMLMERKQELRS